MPADVDQAFIRQMQKKVEQELAAKERECIMYWSSEMEKILKRRHQDLASMENDLQRILTRMRNRLRQL